MAKSVSLDDTIAAISTPIGESGIGIVRISGKDAFSIAEEIFSSKSHRPVSKMRTFTTHHGHIVNNLNGGEVIDEVILTVMRAPKTYTREDIVEINCHSGIVPLKKVLNLVLSSGARLARPGEFTKRAYLNGRIDLAQAEAVLDIIRAKTDASLKTALAQLKGELSKKVKALRAGILKVHSKIEAIIDFSDQDSVDQSSLNGQGLVSDVDKIIERLDRIISSFEQGQILREGLKIVICGRPNVGKSSLMNAFLRRDRVIVTPLPGTTRDSIEEVVNIGGLPLRIIDTAGWASAPDYVAYHSIKRTSSSVVSADLVLFLLDGSQPLIDEDKKIFQKIRSKKFIVVINKIDLPLALELDDIIRMTKQKKIIKISAIKKTGLELLEKEIADTVWQGGLGVTTPPLVSNVRHKDILARVRQDMARAKNGIIKKTSPEIIAIDLKSGLDNLAEIAGETATEDLLENIFSQFCIGK